MAHCVVPEAEEILDKEYPVLDKGFVRLVDYFGGDHIDLLEKCIEFGLFIGNRLCLFAFVGAKLAVFFKW